MYCSKCGAENADSFKFCEECGAPLTTEKKATTKNSKQPKFDAVKDLKKKLKEIDNRKRPESEKKSVKKAIGKVLKKEATLSEVLFEDSFEDKKREDKKQLVLEYPIPTAPKELAKFAKYIYSEIVAKRKESESIITDMDPMPDVWNQKIQQVYSSAKSEMSSTKEFAEIEEYYNAINRRKKHESIRKNISGFDILLYMLVVVAVITSFFIGLPWVMFVAIAAFIWGTMLLMYVYDVLEKPVVSINIHCKKKNPTIKKLAVICWYLLAPIVAGMTVAAFFNIKPLLAATAILLGIDVFYLLGFLAHIYNSFE